MSDLLIHSMAEFAPLILQCLDRANARNIVEIGSEFGGMSQYLAEYCCAHGGVLTSIDPEPREEFLNWAKSTSHLHHIAKPSLEAFGDVSNVDAWVIDGDHNYYTVINELRQAIAVSRQERRPFLAFMHDISWPCAPRDLYYAPERIPEDYRHPHSYEAGVTLDNSGYLINRGWRGMGAFAYALQEGGERNGVLTAVEDFIAEQGGEESGLIFAHIPAVLGLGVLFDSEAQWAEDVCGYLLPYHQNELIAALELNRLRNYLAVIEWQDREAAREGGAI